MTGKRWILSIIAIMWSTVVVAQSLSFTASLNNNSGTLSDLFVYELNISADHSIKNPEINLPSFRPGFAVVGQHQQSSFQFINGNVTNRYTKVIRLRPLQDGQLTIPPAEYIYQGKSYKTDAFTVSISQSAATPSPSVPAPSRSARQRSKQTMPSQPVAAPQQNVFVLSTVSSDSVYVGETIDYESRLYYNVQLFADPQYEKPELSGVWIDSVDVEKPSDIQRIQNRNYHSLILFKDKLTPIQEGTVVIPPTKVVTAISLFSGRELFQSDPITITVEPLPIENKPTTFQGIVGEFTLDHALKKAVYAQNDPISFQITVSGSGSLSRLNELQVSGNTTFRLYPPKVTESSSSERIISKTFDYLLVPQEAGDQTIPSFILSYFSPEDQTYHTISTPEIAIKVTPKSTSRSAATPTLPNQKNVKVLSQDLNYLKPVPLNSAPSPDPFDSMLVLVLCLLNAGVLIGVLALETKQRLFPVSASELIKQNALKVAQKKLSTIQSSPSTSDDQLIKIQTTFINFLSDKTGQPLLGATQHTIQQAVQNLGISPDKVQDVTQLLSDIDYAIYTPQSAQANQYDALCQRVNEHMTSIHQQT